MAYYAALVSLVELLKEMSLSEHQYPNSPFEKQQITSLYEMLSHFQELLEDYSLNDKEAAGFLERIRDGACGAQDFIECHIPDEACHARDIIESYDLNETYPEYVPNSDSRYIFPVAVEEVKSITELQIAEKIHRSNCLEEIIDIALLYFVSACHKLEYVNKEAVYTLRGGYEDLGDLTRQLGSVMYNGYKTLAQLIKSVRSVTKGKRCLDELKLEEELYPIAINGYQDLVKLKKELDAIMEKEYHDVHRAKRAVDSILNRGNQDLGRVKEAVDFIVGKGCKYFMQKVNEEVDSIVGRGYQDLERVKEEMCSIVGRGYHDWKRVKREVDSLVIKGYQDLLKLKDELDNIRIVGNEHDELEHVNDEFYFTVRRGYKDLKMVKKEVDFVVEKGYKDILEKVKEEVDSIVKDLKRVKGKSRTTHQDELQVGAGGVSTQGPSDGTTMVGFEQHQTTLKAQLYGDSSDLEVISIVGMGGVGKTTLARNIFDDERINKHFDFRVWVTVSQNYHLPNVLGAIVNSLEKNKEDLGKVEEDVLKGRIYKHLFGWRYLIIMDDVWDIQIWDDVKWIFPNVAKGSRILVTTRQSDVASFASEPEFKNIISTLKHHESWSLFCEKVHCPPKLEGIGRLIVKHCGGLPLAIVVVAGLLSKTSKTRDHWEDIARRLSSTAAENDERFSKILSLSYDCLPHYLKPCFLYLGGFPEDYEISISRLVKLWVAEGFLKPIASKCLEEVAEEYLEELVKRNLVLIAKRRANGKFKSCILHDLLRDLCLERALHEHFFLLSHKHIATDHADRFFIHPRCSLHIDMRKNNVRSIVSCDAFYCKFISYPSNFKSLRLRVFDGPLVDDTFLAGGVCELLNLRFLGLTYPSIIPPILQLQHLQTLIVDSVHEFSLPAEIWKMTRLRHVLGYNVKLPHIYYGERKMSVQTLSRILDFKFTSQIAEMIPSIKKLKLKYAQKYKRCKNAWTSFGLTNLVDLHKLETLAIEIDIDEYVAIPFPEGFAFPSNLRELTLKGCRLPWENMMTVGALPHLHLLKLRWNSFLGEEWESKEGEFPKLKFLLMEDLYSLHNWRTETSHFPCLEQLVINRCIFLDEIPSEIGEFPNLKLIELKSTNSRVEASALEIHEEQLSVGNETLQVRIN